MTDMYDVNDGLVIGPFILSRFDTDGGIWMERNDTHPDCGEGAQMNEKALAEHLERFYAEHF